MKINPSRWMFILSLSVAAGLSFFGCSDSSSSSDNGEDEEDNGACTQDVFRCSGAKLEKCIDGSWKSQETCKSADDCLADSGSCKKDDSKQEDSKQDECSGDTYQCSGAVLQKCVDGSWKSQETCASEGKCNAQSGKCNTCEASEHSCKVEDGKSIYTWCDKGDIKTQECAEGCEGDLCKSDLCPNNPDKTEPGTCGCDFEDKDINGDGVIDCPVKTFPDDALPDLPDIEGSCAEWSYPKHPKIEYPNLPEYSYETTIDISKYNISNVYDVSKAVETTKGLNKAISDAKEAGFTRIVIPDGHYPIVVDFDRADTSALNPPDGVAIIMSPNVKLQQIPTKAYDCNIINLRSKANIYIEGGQLIGERYEHTLSASNTTDEECNAITSYYSNHIFLNGLKIKSSHGDGILLFDKKDSTRDPSSNFIIANCDIDDVFRNGIAVVGVDGVRITNNEIHHTNGTAPQFGIDFEATGKMPENTNAIVDHNYFHDNVAGDLIIDAYDTFIEYNRFSEGDMGSYIDNPLIIRNHSSYIAYRNNIEKFTKSTGCGHAVCCSYANNYDANVDQKYPSFFVENEITHTRLMLTRRNKVCVKENVIHEGHLSASTIRQLRLINNRVEHYTSNAVPGSFSFQKVYGTASGNLRCSAEDKCNEATDLNSMTDDTEFSNGANYW